MNYRGLGNTGLKVSEIGMGCEGFAEDECRNTMRMFDAAEKMGINYFDLAAAEATPFPAYGKALAGVRDKIYFQIHFGANYETGKYGWTSDLDTIKRSIDWQLKSLNTDYIDFGFIHCIDKPEDLEKYLEPDGVEQMRRFARRGKLIRCAYEIDEGSFLYLQEKIERLRERK